MQLWQPLPKTVWAMPLPASERFFNRRRFALWRCLAWRSRQHCCRNLHFLFGTLHFHGQQLEPCGLFQSESWKAVQRIYRKIDDIKEVDELKAHYNGNLVTLDVVVIVNGTMSVLESYRLGEKIESLMLKNFGIIDTDVSFIPDSASDENEHKNRIRRNRNRFWS